MVKSDFEKVVDVLEEEDEGPRVTSYAEMTQRIEENNALAQQKRQQILERPGGLHSFRERLIYEPVVSDADHALLAAYKNPDTPAAERPSQAEYDATRAQIDARLAEFYKPYEASFPIKGERTAQGGLDAEDPNEGFFGIVTEGNFDPDLKEKFGNFREMMYIVRDPDTKAPIGGMNFIVYPSTNGEPLENEYAATVHSVYVFFDPEHRTLGLARHVMDERNRIAADYVAKVEPELAARSKALLTISEQNIPDQMTPTDYMTDSAFAVLQEQRLEKWYSLGYNRLNFEGQEYDGYVQPALEEGGEPCDILSLNAYKTPFATGPNSHVVVGESQRVDGIAASTLKHHLSGFFATSVVCSADAGNPDSEDHDEITVDALQKLERMGDNRISTFGYEESMANLQKLRPQIADFLKTATPDEIESDSQICELIEARKPSQPAAKPAVWTP